MECFLWGSTQNLVISIAVYIWEYQSVQVFLSADESSSYTKSYTDLNKILGSASNLRWVKLRAFGRFLQLAPEKTGTREWSIDLTLEFFRSAYSLFVVIYFVGISEKLSHQWDFFVIHISYFIWYYLLLNMGWVGRWGFLWWAPSAKRKDHHRVSSGWSSTWYLSNTSLSNVQYEQIPIIFGVWPLWLTPFFFQSITFWRVYG